MDTLDFLRRVLPDSGIFVCAVLNNKKFTHIYCQSPEEMTKRIAKLERKNYNVFYAISSFSEQKRTQATVAHTKVVALDIDCGPAKPYADQKEGIKALKKFLRDSNLPRPVIVSSGNGLHCYWVLTKALPPDRWLPVASWVKQLALDYGLGIDPTITADSARVLRPVNTTNPKGGKKVQLLLDSPPVKVSDLLAGDTPVPSTKHNAKTSKLALALKVEPDLPPAVPEIVRSKCQQVAWATTNAEQVSEPFWYNLMGVAAYCHNPEETAKEWSSGHPQYDPAEAVKKMYQWKNNTDGPATCNRFKNERPKGCQGCPFADKITTPVRLGAQFQESSVEQGAPDKEASTLPIPKPFKRTTAGIKVVIEDTDVDVCSFDIYPVSYGKDEALGYEVVRYHWNRPHTGWQELVFRQALLADGARDFATVIADQGIVLASKRQTEYFQLMLRSYMDELRKKRAMTNLYGSMGWKSDNTQFVLGNTLIRRSSSGSVETKPISLDASGNSKTLDMYGESGTLESWSRFTKVLEQARMKPQMFALGIGLSSVFYAFTGLKGLTISLYGPTGGGKTLAQYWIQSIYGNPDLLHFSSKFTQNSLFHRMGSYCHLPMTIDEVTLMSDKDVADFVYWVSQGRDKARLSRTAQEREIKDWSMPVVVSTNRSINSKLVAAGLDSEAQMMRVLELNVGSHPALTKGSSVGRKIYEFLMNNYGVAGREFLKYLVSLGPNAIAAMVADAPAVLAKDFGSNFTGEERYWEQAISLAYLALRLAHDQEIISFDPKVPVKWVLNELGSIRKQVEESKTDNFEVLSEFINDNALAAIAVSHVGAQTVVDFNRLPRGEVRIRFDLYKAKPQDPTFQRGTLTIHRSYLRKWLSVIGVDYNEFLKDLKENLVSVNDDRTNRAYLGKDTPLKVGQTYVITIDLAHPKLKGLLDLSEDQDSLTMGNLKLVKKSLSTPASS